VVSEQAAADSKHGLRLLPSTSGICPNPLRVAALKSLAPSAEVGHKAPWTSLRRLLEVVAGSALGASHVKSVAGAGPTDERIVPPMVEQTLRTILSKVTDDGVA
jgi:hypothetical protein